MGVWVRREPTTRVGTWAILGQQEKKKENLDRPSCGGGLEMMGVRLTRGRCMGWAGWAGQAGLTGRNCLDKSLDSFLYLDTQAV